MVDTEHVRDRGGARESSPPDASFRTGWFGGTTFQFMANDMLIQSLSMSAVSGWAYVLN